MVDLTGRTFGPYRIFEEIGRGGMAVVYRAVQTSNQREVALKVLPAHFLQDPTFLERFKRETKVIVRLQHPHILPVYDFGDYRGTPYIAMRYLSGGSLQDYLRDAQQWMHLEDVARITQQAAGALDFAHSRGVIHRDFKPGNVLLDEDGNAYLSDFGIAKVAGATFSLTGSGLVGTPAYIAPELSKPGNVTPLIDIYALAATVFEMLTNRQPYQADTPMGLLIAHAVEPIPMIHEVRPDLPGEMQILIDTGIAKNPAERYQSASALSADLDEITRCWMEAYPPLIEEEPTAPPPQPEYPAERLEADTYDPAMQPVIIEPAEIAPVVEPLEEAYTTREDDSDAIAEYSPEEGTQPDLQIQLAPATPEPEAIPARTPRPNHAPHRHEARPRAASARPVLPRNTGHLYLGQVTLTKKK